MKRVFLLLPLAAGAVVLAGLFRALDLDWSALASGDLGAASGALRRAVEAQGPWKLPLLLAMAAFLPFTLVPMTVVLLAMAALLPAPLAIPSILAGVALNTALAWGAGRLWGLRIFRMFGLERLALVKSLMAGAEGNGLKLAIASRFLPSPFVIQAAAGAVLGLRFWQMVLGSVLAMAPWAFAYVYATEALRQGQFRRLGLLLGGAALVYLAVWVAGRRRLTAPAPPMDGEEQPLSPQSPALGPELLLYTLPGDPACQEARRELRRLRPLLGFEVREVDASVSPDLDAQIRDHVPVLFLGAEKLFSFQVDAHLLEVRLGGPRKAAP